MNPYRTRIGGCGPMPWEQLKPKPPAGRGMFDVFPKREHTRARTLEAFLRERYDGANYGTRPDCVDVDVTEDPRTDELVATVSYVWGSGLNVRVVTARGAVSQKRVWYEAGAALCSVREQLDAILCPAAASEHLARLAADTEAQMTRNGEWKAEEPRRGWVSK